MTDKLGVLKNEYWSKSRAFLLPLTGMVKSNDYEMDVTAYLYWRDYSIENYNLIVKVEYGHRYPEYLAFLSSNVLTGNKGFITETYDFEGFSVLIYDISEWAFDIEQFMKGKYSKMSKEAKEVIEDFHIYYENNEPRVRISIYGCLYPNSKQKILNGKTSLEYVCEEYGFDKDAVKIIMERGEICSIVNPNRETLVTEGQIDSNLVVD
jgi:hypothetical protein